MKRIVLGMMCLLVVACVGDAAGPTGPTGAPAPSPSPSPSPAPAPAPGPTPTLPGGTVFFDTFTSQLGEPLTAHRPDRGSAWLLNEDTTASVGQMVVAPGMDWLTPDRTANSGRVSYYAAPPPATADAYIQVTLDNQAEGSSDDFAYLMLRRVDAGTFYAAGWYGAAVPNDCYLFKVVGGAYTQLANTDCNFTGQNSVNSSVIRFTVTGDTLTLYKDGASVMSASGGNSIPAAGFAGVGAGNIRFESDDVSSGLALDDLFIVEVR